MRKLLLFALLLCCFLTPTLAQAATVSEEAFWQLISDLDEELNWNRPIAPLLDQIAAVDSVTLADGTSTQIDTSALIEQFNSLDERRDQERFLDALLDAKELNSAQPQPDSPAVLESVLAQPEFQYDVQESWWQSFWRQVQEWFFNLMRRTSINSVWFGYAAGAVALVVLLLVIGYWLRGLRRQFSAETSLPFSSEADYQLSASDALQRAQQQANEGDYREAVRYLYLSALFSLDDRDQLRFDRSKTNREYLRQVAGTDFAPTLNGVVDVFDRVWYGFQSIDNETYQRYETQVKELAQ